MPIFKAVIPVAGLGTRLLPTTKAVPKEMLPVGRYPIIQHVVEELVAAGLNQQLFVSNRTKVAIENHLDDYSELMLHLDLNGDERREVSRFDYRKRGVEFFFIRQQVPMGQTKPLGTGDAVAAAEHFVGNDHFAVAFGDSIIRSPGGDPLLRRMVRSHQEHGSDCTIGAYEVAPERARNYGILVPAEGEEKGADCRLQKIIEKPAPGQTSSRLAVSARYLFSPRIFDKIRQVQPAPSGEIYLTDAIAALIDEGRMVRAVRLDSDEKRHDIGNHQAYYETFLDYALEDPECGAELQAYLRRKLEI
jgi:UTP--glucose-1-phosphate uridylyltransferase